MKIDCSNDEGEKQVKKGLSTKYMCAVLRTRGVGLCQSGGARDPSRSSQVTTTGCGMIDSVWCLGGERQPTYGVWGGERQPTEKSVNGDIKLERNMLDPCLTP